MAFRELSKKLVSYWEVQAIASGCRLDVFDSIADGANYLKELNTNLSLPFRSLSLLLDALVEAKCVEKDGERYTLTQYGELLTDKAKPSLKSAAIMWASEHYNAWSHLDKALVSEHEQFSDVFGNPFFDYLNNNLQTQKLYHEAIANYAYFDYQCVSEVLHFENGSRVTDVGGSSGTLAEIIVNTNPGIQMTVFDLDLQNYEMENGIEFIAGDFFCDELPKSDYFILSRVLHDWNDEKALKVLENCANSLSAGGKVVVIETLLPADRSWGALLQLNLMLMVGGKERSLSEYKELFIQSKLEIEDVYKLNSGVSVISLRLKP